MILFHLKTDFIELHKLLKITGLCATGGEAKQAIANQLVKVNGQIETRKACKIRGGQQINFMDSKIEIRGQQKIEMF